jgi:hypothetical protein
MSTIRQHLAFRHLASGVAALAALALATGPGAATTVSPPSDDLTSLSRDGNTDDGRPPTTGPTNPAQSRV